jgi:hypothetical protein
MIAATKIELLLEVIDDVVADNGGTFKEKCDAILAACDENDSMNLKEFVSWFKDAS